MDPIEPPPAAAEPVPTEQHNFLSAVVDAIGTPVGVTDRFGCMVHINRAFERMGGYRLDDVRGRPFWDLFLPSEDPEFAKSIFANLPNDGSPAHIEAAWVLRNGQRRLIEWTITVVPNAGEVACVVASGIDITERRQAEEALRQNTERLALAAAGSQQGLYDLDRRTGEVYLSPRLLSILGFTEATAEDNFDDWQDRLHPDDRDRLMDELTAHLQGPSSQYESEYRLRCEDGAYRHVLVRGLSVRDENGWPYRFVGFLADVNESKQAEQMLRTSALVLENMAEGVNVTDERGVLMFTNPPFDAMFGYERGELIGRHASVLDAVSPEEGERMVAQIRERLRSEGVYAGEFANRKKDGTLFATRAHIKWLRLSGSKWWVTVQEDITERRKQVILNLLRNGIEAMEEQRSLRRELSIRTSIADHESLAVSVSDSGDGIDPRIIEKMFDPFFTTKPGGLGMGLAISRSIIESHGGRLWVVANAGPGATFHFTLPLMVDLTTD